MHIGKFNRSVGGLVIISATLAAIELRERRLGDDVCRFPTRPWAHSDVVVVRSPGDVDDRDYRLIDRGCCVGT